MTTERKRERHGMSRTPTYHTWAMMKQRCYDQNSHAYVKYGGRGIKVCERWRDSFVAFLADMGEVPDGKSLDRIDNDGDYSPENCRWATASEQARNTRRTRYVEVDGQKRRAIEVANENGISSGSFHGRLTNGWTTEQALGLEEHYDPRAITIDDETMTMAQWAKRCGISRQAVAIRLKSGWTIEKALTTPKLDQTTRRQRKSNPRSASKVIRELLNRWSDSVLTESNTTGIIVIRMEVPMNNEERERGTWLQVRMSDEEKTLLAQLADEYGVSISALVRMMVTHFDEKRPTVSVRFGPKESVPNGA